MARAAGVTPYILGDSLEGESRDMGDRAWPGSRRQVARCAASRSPRLACLLSGGETTVTVRGTGPRRPQRRVPAVARHRACRENARVHALAGDTDGVDGAEEIAGASIDPTTLSRAFALGINPAESLAANDGHGFFQALGDSVVTGPTLTNVNDFRAILIV